MHFLCSVFHIQLKCVPPADWKRKQHLFLFFSSEESRCLVVSFQCPSLPCMNATCCSPLPSSLQLLIYFQLAINCTFANVGILCIYYLKCPNLQLPKSHRSWHEGWFMQNKNWEMTVSKMTHLTWRWSQLLISIGCVNPIANHSVISNKKGICSGRG